MENVFSELDGREFSESDVGVYSLGRLACEDFLEVMVMADHGLGRAAVKLIRGLDERCVTSEFISRDGGEALAFVRYYVVDVQKASKRAARIYGKEKWADVSSERQKQLEESFQKVKDSYRTEDCEKCGQALQHGWTKLDLPSIARKVDADAEALYLPMANLTNPHIHASMFGFYLRYPTTSDGSFDLTSDQNCLVGDALMGIHTLLPLILRTQSRHFGLNLEKSIKELGIEFHNAWRPNPA